MKLRPKRTTKSSWEKLAHDRGLRDGKAEKPSLDWGQNSVPFLSELHKHALKRLSDLSLKTRAGLNNLVQQSLDRNDRVRLLQNEKILLDKKYEYAENRVKAFQATLDGYNDENPIGRFARTKNIADGFYYPILAILGAGEIFITAPALIKLFNEKIFGTENFAYLIALSVGLLTVVSAHILGLSLKLKLDRQRPQEPWVIKLLYPLVGLVLGSVIALAFLRAGQVFKELPGDFFVTNDLGRKFFLLGFFIFLQLAFIAVATHLAFLHYSKIEHDLRHAKKEAKKIESATNRANKELAELISVSYISNENIALASKTLEAELEVIRSAYLAAAAVYADANIHARRDDINAAHPSLTPPTLIYEVDDFSDLQELIDSGNLEPSLNK